MSKIPKKLLLFILSCLLVSCSHSGYTEKNSKRFPASWDSCYKNLEGIFSHTEAQNIAHPPEVLSAAADLSELEKGYGFESYFSWQSRLSEENIREVNEKTLTLLNENPAPKKFKVQIEGQEKSTLKKVNRSQAQTLYNDVETSPCVTNHSSYDRPGVALGYCFGRATMAHMAGLVRGINPNAMKKIWVVGEMHGNWGHHVALMVRGENKKWYVIDNVSGLVTHDQWINQFKGMKKNKDVMFFVSSANRFGPETTESYNPVTLFNVQEGNFESFSKEDDYYRGFFHDLFKWIDDRPEQFQRFKKE